MSIEAARRLYASGEAAAADALLDRIPPQDPSFAAARFFKAERCHVAGRAGDAIETMLPLLAIAPDAAAAWANFALIVQTGNARLADLSHRRAVRLAPNDAAILLNAARASILNGELGAASRLFLRALLLVPDDAQAVTGFAMMRPESGQLHWLGRALALGAPAVATFAYASRLQVEGRLDEAEREFRRAACQAWRESGARSAAPAGRMQLGIGWKPARDSGWGVYGTSLVERLAARGDYEAVIINPIIAAALQGDLENAALYRHSLDRLGPALCRGETADFPCLVALGNDLIAFPRLIDGRREIGVIFLEYTAIGAAARARGMRFERLVAGSRWGAEILRGAGFPKVDVVLQGIDPKRFHFRPRPERGANFRIFSGGKLEFRKGQDIVIEAFRRFHQRRRDAKLVVAWQSPWPEAASRIALGGLVASSPALTANRRLDIGPWLASLGLSEDSVEILDLMPNPELPDLLAAMDCALFPNRCEGGTNLVAMECMALGVPTILSANTGHIDLIEAGNCLALERQRPLPTAMPQGVEGWGESDIDEIVERLDALYLAPDLGRAIGVKAAATLERLTWPRQIDKLLDLVGSGG